MFNCGVLALRPEKDGICALLARVVGVGLKLCRFESRTGSDVTLLPFAWCAFDLTRNSCDAPDSSIGVIILGVLLAALLLCNAICCFMFKRRKKSPSPVTSSTLAPVYVHDDAELGRLR